MKSRIILCLLLIMTVLTFGACGDTTPENVVDDNDNVVQKDMDEAVDDAQEEVNDMDGKDTTQRGPVENNPDVDNNNNSTNE
ncbi:MAG: hypothetical protein PHW03_00205 [Eubacteriales bacterium]|nr:hypothetical protein [Eubacteriales bacterium]MDD4389208.1 hypothetical protein [Eubacteriales bacterium]